MMLNYSQIRKQTECNMSVVCTQKQVVEAQQGKNMRQLQTSPKKERDCIIFDLTKEIN